MHRYGCTPKILEDDRSQLLLLPESRCTVRVNDVILQYSCTFRRSVAPSQSSRDSVAPFPTQTKRTHDIHKHTRSTHRNRLMIGSMAQMPPRYLSLPWPSSLRPAIGVGSHLLPPSLSPSLQRMENNEGATLERRGGTFKRAVIARPPVVKARWLTICSN